MKSKLLIIPFMVISCILTQTLCAQENTVKNDTVRRTAIRVFLDCYDCDMNFTRQQIPYINYVRDVKEAQVYILVTDQNTASGGEKFTYTAPLRFCKNPTANFKELELNLTLNYQNPNDGSSSINEANITNLFDVNLPKCKIRFMMKKGDYEVSGGSIYQTIENNSFSIVDVNTKVEANTTQKVKIYQSK